MRSVLCFFLVLTFRFANPTVSIGENLHGAISYSVVGDGAVVRSCAVTESLQGPESNATLEIPETLGGHKVVAIDRAAFRNCGRIKEVRLPCSVTNIGCCAFENCVQMKSVTIPSGVKNIGDEAFAHCISLTAVDLPACLESVRYGVFRGCSELSHVTIPPSVTNVEANAFEGTKFATCSHNGLVVYGSVLLGYSGRVSRCVVIPSNVKTIADNALTGCQEVETLTIPDGVISVGESAFRECENLTFVEISRTVKSIGTAAFSLCPHLVEIEVDKQNENYASMGGAVYDKVRRQMLLCPQGRSSLIVSPGTHGIAELSCNLCTNLVTIAIPDGVVRIGEAAFESCIGLVSVTMPLSVKRIDRNAFSGCVSLSCVRVERGDAARVRQMLQLSGCNVDELSFEERDDQSGYGIK